MAKKEHQYHISITGKERLFSAWAEKTTKNKNATAGALLLYAIQTFIDTGEFADIGHIYVEKNKNFRNVTPITLFTFHNPIVERWLNANIESGLGISKPVKLIMENCIKEVNSEEEEYFPTLTGANKAKGSKESLLEIMLQNAKKVSGGTATENRRAVVIEHSQPILSIVPEAPDVSSPEAKKQSSSEQISVPATNPPSVQEEPQNKTERKKIPVNLSAAANGINALMPKRG